MTDPRTVIAYISEAFPYTKEMFDDVPHRELCNALAYQYILREHRITKSVDEILTDEPFIGLLGTTDEFERESEFLDRGYLYCFDAPKCLKGCPLLGHITGFWFCLRHNLLS